MDALTHPAASLPASLRFEYVAVLVAIVYADGTRDERELALVRRLCEALHLDAHDRQRIEAATRAPNAELVQSTVRFVGSIGDHLRFALMADALAFSFVDGKLTSSEIAELWTFARALEVPQESVVAIAKWVEGVLCESRGGGAPLSRALDAALEGLPLDPISTAAAVRWLDATLRRTS